MPTIAELLATAFKHHQAGELAQAEQLYRQILLAEPNHADTWHLLGVVLHQTRRQGEAIECIARAIRLNPANGTYYNHLGAAYGASGQIDDAVASFRAALRLAPADAQAHFNLASVLGTQGKLNEAAAEYQAAIRFQPNFPQANFNLANLVRDHGRPREAAAYYREAIRLKPDYAEALNNLGAVLNTLGELDEGIQVLRQAIAIKPSYLKAHINLGVIQIDRGELEAAKNTLRQVLAGDPNSAEALNNLGVALMHQQRLEEALVNVERALALAPEYAEAHKNRAAIWLFQGNYEQGWKEFEWRFRSKGFAPNPFREPTWDGGRLDGRTILLHAEQGLGDAMQFLRFVPLVKPFGGQVIFRCPKPLVRLLANLEGVDQLVPVGEPLPAFDVQASLMSLPGIFGISLTTVPADVPYLHADDTLVEQWRTKLATIHGFKIGIAWQGNPEYGADRFRSIPLAQFAPLARVPGVQLVSLQKGPGEEQLAALRDELSIVDLASSLDTTSGPFMDTAAVMKNLDLVITCDTAAAHLAGALAVPTWLALASTHEWRWLRERTDTPWYPTMRLFRQSELGLWPAVFEQMAGELPKLMAAGSNR